MKKLYPTLPFITGLMALCLCATSCLKEDDSDCKGELTLRFSYTTHPHDTDLFDREVGALLLVAFDETDRFLSGISIPSGSLGPGNTFTFRPDDEACRFIAWGNLDTSHQVTGIYRPGEVFVHPTPDPSGETNPSFAELFYGSATTAGTTGSRTTVDVPMVKNTKNIRVLIPLADTRTLPGTDLSVRITGSCGALDFENHTVTRPITYKPDYSVTTYKEISHHLAGFRVLRLRLGDDTAICIRSGAKVVKEDNLVRLLTAHFPEVQTDADLERYSDYEFVYRLDSDGVPVLSAITVGPWTRQMGQQGGI